MRRMTMSMLALAALFPLFSCRSGGDEKKPDATDQTFALMRERMVTAQIESRGVRDPRVLAAMRKVPRHLFVPEASRGEAYEDHPLPIGGGQTISQPYIVALMSELLDLDGSEKILEIGTGSGYQAALLGELAKDVFSMEIVPALAERSGKQLKNMGYMNIRVRCGDGYEGWPEEAPFDAVIVTAAPDHIPEALVSQLKPGGRIVVPVGRGSQDLVLGVKTVDGLSVENIIPVRFVPMVKGKGNR